MVARLDEAVAAFDQPSMDGINTYFRFLGRAAGGLESGALRARQRRDFRRLRARFARHLTSLARPRIARLLPQPLRASFAGALADARTPFGSSPDAIAQSIGGFSRSGRAAASLFLHAAALHAASGRFRAAREVLSVERLALVAMACRCGPPGELDGSISQGFPGSSLRSYHVNTLLRDTDAMSMRHSLEVRVPFLDSPLVEYVLSLPEAAKRARGASEGAADRRAWRSAAGGNGLAARSARSLFRGRIGCAARWASASRRDWRTGRRALEPQVERRFALRRWKIFLRAARPGRVPGALYVLNEWVKRNSSPAMRAGVDCQKVAAAVAMSD